MDEPDSLIWVKIYILELWMKSDFCLVLLCHK